MRDDQFAGYAYAYPHKTSYRRLEPSVRLSDAWWWEEKDALFLYVHVPFCEMRCGFCNLFTTVRPDEHIVSQTLDAIDRQSRSAAAEIRPERISQVAFGGGTPSFLSVENLERLFRRLSATWPIDWNAVEVSFEVSPATIDAEKLSLLRAQGVDRISMGVQSFSADDLRNLGRPQSVCQAEAAIAAIQSAGFAVFNLDLIYGVDGQTERSWLRTIRRAVAVACDEIYLYPLYVREATGLGRTGKSPSARRRELLLTARDALVSAGYRQQSMRLFRRGEIGAPSDYCCQEDGMIGLGPGARSYTRQLHYSSEYAVGQTGVKRIIAEFNARDAGDFAHADYGVRLDAEEQRRRYLIKSLLRAPGLDLAAYRARFGTDVEDDFPQLSELLALELGVCDGLAFRLTPEGLSWGDVIGPWLYSPHVTSRMEAFQLV
jgi:oxygen-independent coproporphyrinogen-3 oxidase